MSRKNKNTSRIKQVLENESNELSGTELATKAQIDIKNLSKYTKELIESKEIIERTDQNGKIRTKYYKINQNTSDRPTLPITTRKEELITSRNNESLNQTTNEGSAPPIPQNPELRIPEPNRTIQENLYIPEFNDLLAFCKLPENQSDIECLQFLTHNDPELAKERGGGGHVGATKSALAIQRKMAKAEVRNEHE